MLSSNHVAFKEWAAVCAALGDGWQTLIVRKGGLHEGGEGFRVAHREFWLFPTYAHEAAAALDETAVSLVDRALSERPPSGSLRFAHYAVVSDVFDVRDEAALPRLAGLHVWSARTIDERFHYREPRLFVLIVRIYALAEGHLIPDSVHFAGCRSWVELPVELSTAGLIPVLSDSEFARRQRQIELALSADRQQRTT
ncbi:MAG TPA: DUF1802 family protein [Planctomycetaceae bacterium]|nr:DUF1802 family protein [Planctomycetaceae bacterium]